MRYAPSNLHVVGGRHPVIVQLPGHEPQPHPLAQIATPAHIASLRQRIADACQEYDAIQLLANVVMHGSFRPAESYSEATHPSIAVTEYIATTLLERSEPAGRRAMTRWQSHRAAGAVQQSLDAGQSAAMMTMFYWLGRRDAARTPIKRIAALFETHDTFIRGPGYEAQAKHYLSACFADDSVDARLAAVIGFTGADALRLEEALTQLQNRRMNGELQMITRITQDLDTIVHLTFLRAEHGLCFTASDLSTEANLDPALVASFIDAFTIGFGAPRPRLPFASGGLPIRSRPIVAAGDGRYLCTSSLNLLWALAPRLEDALRGSPAWDVYQSRRASHIEEIVMSALVRAMGGDVWRNVRFEIANGPRYEIDGLVIVDDLCFVVEGKGGRLSAAARMGRSRALRNDLHGLVGRATSQSLRLATAIQARDEVLFFNEDGGPLEIPIERVGRVEPVIVTLEEIAWLAQARNDLVAAGLIDADALVPWAISWFDLDSVLRLVEFPAQLTLYLEERRRIQGRIPRADELDLFVAFLERGLEFPEDADLVLVTGWTDQIDRHEMFGLGELPRMPLSDPARRRLRELARERPEGFLRVMETVITQERGA